MVQNFSQKYLLSHGQIKVKHCDSGSPLLYNVNFQIQNLNLATAKRYYITRIGVVYLLKRQQPHWDENVSSRPPFGLQWRGIPHTTGQAAAGPKFVWVSFSPSTKIQGPLRRKFLSTLVLNLVIQWLLSIMTSSKGQLNCMRSSSMYWFKITSC